MVLVVYSSPFASMMLNELPSMWRMDFLVHTNCFWLPYAPQYWFWRVGYAPDVLALTVYVLNGSAGILCDFLTS
jgi:hypothetical protein